MPHRNVWFYGHVWSRVRELREGIRGFNINRFLNDAVLEHVAALEGAGEELQLEADVDSIRMDLDRVQALAGSVLKHGSYASAYVDELRGVDPRRIVVDLPPYNVRRERPEISEDELRVVEEAVAYREGRVKELLGKVDRLIKLKAERAGVELPSVAGSKPELAEVQGCTLGGAPPSPAGERKVGSREFYRQHMRTPDVEVNRAFEEVERINAEIRRKHEAKLDAKEAEKLAGEGRS